MPLDHNIILQGGRNVTPLKDRAQIDDERAQREMHQMQLQQARQGIADDQQYRQAIQSGATGGDLATDLRRRGLGKHAVEAEKHQTEQQKAQFERGKAAFEGLGRVANSVLQNPSEQFAISAIDDYVRTHGLDAQTFDGGKQAIYAARNNPDEIRRLMVGLGAKAEEMLGKITSENMGGHVQTQRVDPATGQISVLGRQQRTQSPDSIASNATAMRGQNMADARAREANASGRVPSGYRLAADGQGLEFIPGGPADPARKEGGAGKPLTEGQSKSLMFGSRMQEANDIFDALESDGKVFSTPGSRAGYGVGGVVNALNTSAGQQLDQAKRNFINAVLRKESGAVISESEFANAEKQYFPQPGEGKEVIAQKKRNRLTAQRGMLADVPDGDSRVSEVLGQPPARNTFEGGKAEFDKKKAEDRQLEDLLTKYGG